MNSKLRSDNQDTREVLKMKRLILVALVVCVVSPVLADDFQISLATAEKHLKAGNYGAAFSSIKSVAERGDVKGQVMLGMFYFKGVGTLQDYTRAHMWLNIASSRGDKNAQSLMDVYTKMMSSQQIEIAQKLAGECINKKYRNC